MSTADSAAEGAAVGTPARATVAGPSYIAWTALALMTVSSVASLRPAPTMAVYGLAAVFLYVLPAIVFLIPTALVSAELRKATPGRGPGGTERYGLRSCPLTPRPPQ